MEMKTGARVDRPRPGGGCALEVVEMNVDELLEELEHLKRSQDALRARREQIEDRIVREAGDGPKTRYVEGERRRAKITDPSTTFDRKRLREIWEKYPRLRDRLLKISEVSVGRRELAMAVKTRGPKQFNEFVFEVAAAEREPTSRPRVEVLPEKPRAE